MSEENAELAAYFRAILPDGTDVAEMAKDDADWAAFTGPFAEFIAADFAYEDNVMPDHFGETYRGLEGWRRAWATYAEPYEEMVFELERVLGAGERHVSIHRVRTKARHTGIVQDSLFFYAWTYRDGKLARIEGFLDQEDALRAAGLQD